MKLLKFLLFVSFFFINGCSTSISEQSELKWFDKQELAINFGIKEENLSEQDIIGKVEKAGDTFIVFKKSLTGGISVGVASISEKNGEYAWYRANALTLVKYNGRNSHPEIETGIETQSGEKFTLYLGVVEDDNFRLHIRNKNVKPFINKESHIYYYII